MLKIKQFPYHLLLAASIIILFVSFIPFNYWLDIHLHDTYYVISYQHLLLVLAIVLSIYWIINYLSGKLQYLKWMTWLHVLLVLLATCILLGDIFFFSKNGLAGTPRRYYDYSTWDIYLMGGMKSVAIATLLLIAAALLLFINITVGLLKKGKS